MERDSILYKFRRKIQVVAFDFISNERLSKIYFRIVLKKKLNLKNPQTFNEKLQWLKLYYYPSNQLVVKCADKFLAREYVKEKAFGDLLVPLIASWQEVDQINWNKLPDQFVLKCNHGCAYNLVCSNISTFDKEKALLQLSEWLKEDFGRFNVELHYSKIRDKVIMCEKYLGDELTDYKFFCFNGKPEFIYVSNDLIHDRQAQIGFFNLDGSKMELKRDDYVDIPKVILPDFYEEMLSAAEALCKDFPFVRVDFFVTNTNYYFAELTFTPSACMMPINPPKYDKIWGDMLDIKDIMKCSNK